MSDDQMLPDPLNEPLDAFTEMRADVSVEVGDLADLLAPVTEPVTEGVVDPVLDPVAGEASVAAVTVPAPVVEPARVAPPAVTLDVEIPWDVDGDGLAQWDTDGDGVVDFVEQDQDRDGVVDYARIDLEFDGVMDHAGADSTGDGVIDTVETFPPPPPAPGPVALGDPVDPPEVLLSDPQNQPAAVTGLLPMPEPGVIDVTPINPFGGQVNVNELPSSANSSVVNFSGLPFGPPALVPPQFLTGSLANNSLGAALGQVQALLQATPQQLLTAPTLPPRTPTNIDAIFRLADPVGQPLFSGTGLQLDPLVNSGGTALARSLLGSPIPGLTGDQPLSSFARSFPGFFVPGQQPVGALRDQITAALQ